MNVSFLAKCVLVATGITTANAGLAVRSEPIQPIEVPQGLDAAKVELGKKLFFDPRLSKSGFISCNSCHNLATGGADNLPSSIGHGWQIGPINSPTVLNSDLNFVQFWDGRAKDLKDQAGGPIANPGEMASTHELAIDILNSIPGYVAEFKQAYGTDKIDLDKVTDAIATFEKTLVTPNSPFDQWLKGDDKALTAESKAGYDLFKTKGCVSCHMGPGVGGTSFQKMGLVHAYTKDVKTVGRMGVTKKESDKYFFKVPLLRNVELTAPYFHDGSAWTLEEAVDTMAWHQLGIRLTKDENAKLVAFLKSLTGEQPQIIYPILPPSSGKTPKPASH